MKLYIGMQPANLTFDGDERPVFWEGSMDVDSVAEAKVAIYETTPCFNTHDIEFETHNGILYGNRFIRGTETRVVYKIVEE